MNNQSKCVVCCSVVHAFNQNKQAVWDPCFLLKDEADLANLASPGGIQIIEIDMITQRR